MKPFVQKDLIFMTLAGSYMYGTSRPESDIDKRGVCIPPKNVVMGFARRFEQQEFPGEDTVVYGLTKFMQLAADCNPNVIELLFAPEDSIEVIRYPWNKLLERRNEFLTAQAYHKFTGYAQSQLKRIKTHRAWLLDPPRSKPTREEYGLKPTSEGIRELSRGVDVGEISGEVVDVIRREKAYTTAKKQYNQYQGWKKNRNPARAALETQNGYDTKHAMHLVRLLRMGNQILTEGKLDVRREDAVELLEIRNGKWTYDELMDNVNPLFEKLESIYKNKTYVVPDRVDREELSDFCVELHEMYWNKVK